MSAWSLGKYALALLGVALALLGDQVGRPWIGYVGIGLLIVAFLLRFVNRAPPRRPAPPEHP